MSIHALLLLAALLAAPSHLRAQSDTGGLLLSGQVHAPEGYSVAGVQASVFCDGVRADTAMLGPEGTFELRSRCPTTPELQLNDPRDRFLPARFSASPDSEDLAVVLVPRLWRITAGTYAGQVVEVDLAAASLPACRGCSGFFHRPALGGRWPGIPSWTERSFPLRLAFDHEDGAPITPRDSAAVVAIAGALEQDLGRRLFRPSRTDEVYDAVDGDPHGSIIVSIDPQLSTPGRGNWASQGGEIMAGVVFLRSRDVIHATEGRRIISHEIMHTLGFGHTCSWRSVMSHESCRSRWAPAPTPEDVAHAQLLLTIRNLERVVGAQGGIAATQHSQLRTQN